MPVMTTSYTKPPAREPGAFVIKKIALRIGVRRAGVVRARLNLSTGEGLRFAVCSGLVPEESRGNPGVDERSSLGSWYCP